MNPGASKNKGNLINLHLITISAVFIVYLALRLYRLDYHDLWYDEVAMLRFIRYPFRQWNIYQFYFMQYFWTKAFGCSEFILRLPCALFSFFSIIMTYLLGRELFNKKVGFLATIFIGLSPFHLWYAQEARNYSMALFFGVVIQFFSGPCIKNQQEKIVAFFHLNLRNRHIVELLCDRLIILSNLIYIIFPTSPHQFPVLDKLSVDRGLLPALL